MSYPKKTLRLRPRKGQATDPPAWMVGPEYFTQADNVLFRLGAAERAPNVGEVYDPPSVAPYIMRNVDIDGTNFWIYAGATASYAVQTSVHTDITHAGGQTSQTTVGKLSLELLNGVPVFNNTIEEPMYWDGNVVNNYVDLPGWTAGETCEALVAHKFHLFALGMTESGGVYPDKLKWSDAAAPGNVPSSWTASATNEAGDTVLGDSPGPLITAVNLRGSLAIYKSGSVYLADYIGGNEIFSFRQLFGQAGALTRHAVVDVNGRHLCVTDGDIVIHDGSSIASIAEQRRRRYLFNSLDQDNYENLFVTYFRKQGEVWICFPEAGSSQCTRAMVYDLHNDAWGDRELPGITYAAPGIINDTAVADDWDSQSGIWDSETRFWNVQNFSNVTEDLVLAEPDAPDFLQVGTGSTSLTSTLARHDLDFNEPERFKFVKRVHIRVEADTSIDFNVRIGTRNATGESISWGASVTLNSDAGFVNYIATGRYISVEVTTTTTDTFKITGLDLEAEMRGYH